MGLPNPMLHKMSILRHKVGSHPFPPPSWFSPFSYWLFHLWIIGGHSSAFIVVGVESYIKIHSPWLEGYSLFYPTSQYILRQLPPLLSPFLVLSFCHWLFHFWIIGETFVGIHRRWGGKLDFRGRIQRKIWCIYNLPWATLCQSRPESYARIGFIPQSGSLDSASELTMR